MKKYLKPLIYTVLLITLAYVPRTQAVMPSGRGHITQANVNEPHVRGLIPLHQAAQEGDMTTIHFLINQLAYQRIGLKLSKLCLKVKRMTHRL